MPSLPPLPTPPSVGTHPMMRCQVFAHNLQARQGARARQRGIDQAVGAKEAAGIYYDLVQAHALALVHRDRPCQLERHLHACAAQPWAL